MTEAEAQFKEAGITQALICGELYVHHADGKRERVHDVIAFARAPESASDLERFALSALRLVGDRWPNTWLIQ